MILKALIEYIATQVPGQYFIGYLPNVSPATAFIPTPGMTPEAKSGYNKPTFQVSTRDTDYERGYNKMMSIYNYLQSKHGQIGSYFVVQILALQSEPATFRDDQERYRFTQNYLLEYRYKTDNRD